MNTVTVRINACYQASIAGRAVRARRPLPSSENFLAIRSELPGRRDMAVEGLAAHAELGTEVPDVSVGLAHGGHCEAKLGGGHLERSPAGAAAGACGGQPGGGALGDQFSSNSAKAAKMPNTSLPEAVVVSIAAPWPVRTFSPILRWVRS